MEQQAKMFLTVLAIYAAGRAAIPTMQLIQHIILTYLTPKKK